MELRTWNLEEISSISSKSRSNSYLYLNYVLTKVYIISKAKDLGTDSGTC